MVGCFVERANGSGWACRQSLLEALGLERAQELFATLPLATAAAAAGARQASPDRSAHGERQTVAQADVQAPALPAAGEPRAGSGTALPIVPDQERARPAAPAAAPAGAPDQRLGVAKALVGGLPLN